MTTSAEVLPGGSAPSDRPSDYAAMWFGFLGGPFAWSISELVPYMLVAHTCYPNIDALGNPNSGAAWPAALAVTVCMLLVSLGALAVSWRRSLRFMAGDARGYDEWAAASHRAKARRYLAFGGILFGAVFTAFVVYNLIALLAEPACRAIS